MTTVENKGSRTVRLLGLVGVALLLGAGVTAALANFVAWPIAAVLGLVSAGAGWSGGVLLQRRAARREREAAWAAAVTAGPGSNAEASGVLSDLLPERQLVPYSPLHSSVLRELVRRAADRERVIVVAGGPGAGKTRLLVEAADTLAARCGWVIPGREAAAVAAAAELGEPVVLLVDDADTRTEAEALLLALFDADAPGVCAVLAARTPSLWWALIRDRLPTHVLRTVPVRPQVSVPGVIGGAREQQQMFRKALRYFTPRGVEVPDAELVAEEAAPSMMLIQAAAALAAQDGRDQVVGVASVVSRLFEMERGRWRSTAELHELGATPENVLRRAVMLAALVGAADAATAEDLFGCLPELAGPAAAQQRRAVAAWVRDLYPQQVPDWVAPRLPAMLLEQYAATLVQDDPDLVAAIVAAAATDESARRLITSLMRASTHSPVGTSAVHTVLSTAGYRMTCVAVSVVAATAAPFDGVIATVIEERGTSWTVDELEGLVRLIPERSRRRVLRTTIIVALRGYLERAGEGAGADRVREFLGNVLAAQGRYKEAEAEFRTVLTARTEALGAEHPDTLNTRNNLAVALRRQGRYEQADAEFRTVLTARTATLGTEHRDTFNAHINLANILIEQSLYQQAEAEYRAVLDSQTAALGAEHPDTISIRNNLAVALRGQGQYEQAEAEFRAVLAARTATLGAEHADTMGTRNNLAVVLDELGRPDQAEAEYRAVLAARTQTLGAEHPDTLNTRNSLANVLRGQDHYEQAEAEFRAVLAAQTEILGARHRDTLSTRNNLAIVLRGQGRYEQAEAEYRAVLGIQTATLGAEHPDTLSTRNNLAVALRELGLPDQAEAEFRAVLEGRTTTLGAEHPETLRTRHSLSNLLRGQGRMDA